MKTSQATTIQPTDPFDLSELRKWRYHPTSKFLYAINDENEINCLSKDWRSCLVFADEDAATKRISSGTSTDEMNASLREGRVLQCRPAEHNAKWGTSNPYTQTEHWCFMVRQFYYDKWLCSDFTKLNIAMWIDFRTKSSQCASIDGQVCATFTLEQCKALTNSPSIVKIDMGYYNSLRKTSPITISGKIFIYNDAFTLPRRPLPIIQAANPSLGYWDMIRPTEVMNIASFTAPRDLQLLKFFVSMPQLGFTGTPGGWFCKIKAILKIDETILSVVEIIQPGDLRKRGLIFNGVAQSIKKGQHSMFLEFITWGPGGWVFINEGKYRVGLEGY